ncbi:hypothetical protein EGR_05900 [Echinococcus granulosus]|uniref:Uncharacterized protein n=1 Tax=Echinococcus granulosus TaxID=6210 RepID=W6UM05_ECHGR|nr:hypothetical protein EGR_05900 [Echinococcus granulosus]EUB59172.1 hypothetical protein EGR_05900 [Echinococcus granulosus]
MTDNNTLMKGKESTLDRSSKVVVEEGLERLMKRVIHTSLSTSIADWEDGGIASLLSRTMGIHHHVNSMNPFSYHLCHLEDDDILNRRTKSSSHQPIHPVHSIDGTPGFHCIKAKYHRQLERIL